MKKELISAALGSLLALSMTMQVEACNTRTVLFGDSNTAGSNWDSYKYDDNKKWSSKLAMERPVFNKGVGGNTTGMALARMEDVLNKNPDTVTIMFGTNDAVLNSNFIPKTSWRQFEINLNKMVDTFQSKGIDPILMTTLPIVEKEYYKRHDKDLYLKYGGARQFHDKYNDITRKVAEEQGVSLMDTYKHFLRFSGEATDQALIESKLIDPSGTHMSEYGARVFHSNLEILLHSKHNW